MNNLNSVLIEGELVADPVLLDSKVVRFNIASTRFHKINDILEKETGYFPVIAGGRLGTTCFETLKKGRVVRVVGRLMQVTSFDEQGNGSMAIVIDSEHVEFRPVIQQVEEKAS